MEIESRQTPFNKQYTVAIDTVPLPESPEKRARLVMRSLSSVINQIMSDAMSVAIGTWPTPESPEIGIREMDVATQQGAYNKQYTVAIDTVPMPDKPQERVDLVSKSVMPVINQIMSDAMTVAIGTWPTPDKPQMIQKEFEREL